MLSSSANREVESNKHDIAEFIARKFTVKAFAKASNSETYLFSS